jgi:hypothetical protein
MSTYVFKVSLKPRSMPAMAAALARVGCPLSEKYWRVLKVDGNSFSEARRNAKNLALSLERGEFSNDKMLYDVETIPVAGPKS